MLILTKGFDVFISQSLVVCYILSITPLLESKNEAYAAVYRVS